jgi:hypothetical protein
MSLADKQWNIVNVYQVIAAFLFAERQNNVQKLVIDRGFMSAAEVDRLLNAPDINNPDDNYFRLRMLYFCRNSFFGELPPDTVWHEVKYLTDAELGELYVIGRCGWDDPNHNDRNELFNVATRRADQLDTPPDQWRPIILWGHNSAGPFTIIEGNHRLVAYARSGLSGLRIPVHIGISKNNFFFHLADLPRLALYDFWKTRV